MRKVIIAAISALFTAALTLGACTALGQTPSPSPSDSTVSPSPTPSPSATPGEEAQ